MTSLSLVLCADLLKNRPQENCLLNTIRSSVKNNSMPIRYLWRYISRNHHYLFIATGTIGFSITLCPAAEAVAQKIVKRKLKFTNIHLTDQCNRLASIIDKIFERTDDFIHQYLIQYMANNSEVCPVIYGREDRDNCIKIYKLLCKPKFNETSVKKCLLKNKTISHLHIPNILNLCSCSFVHNDHLYTLCHLLHLTSCRESIATSLRVSCKAIFKVYIG